MKIGQKVYVVGFAHVPMCVIAVSPEEKIVTCIAWTSSGWNAYPLPEDILCVV